MPSGRIWQYGNIGICTDPIRVFFLCYTVRVVRDRFPFTCIKVEDTVLKKTEQELQIRSLRHFFDMNREGNGVVLCDLLCEILKLGPRGDL